MRRGTKWEITTVVLISATAAGPATVRRRRATQAGLAVAAIVAAGLGLAACATGSRGSCSRGAPLELAYSDGEGIILVALDGRSVGRVSRPRTGWVDADPAWSPDGTRIAFARYFAENPSGVDLFIAAADGHDQKLRQVGALRPSWSPGGHALLVERTNGHDFWSAIIDPDGKVPEIELAAGPAAWSPDGRRLATTSYDGLAVADSQGRHPTNIWRGRSLSSPAWSPNGNRVAFVGLSGHTHGTAALWSVDADGTGSKLLFEGHRPGAPQWSPDGRRIVFATVRSGRGAIELIDAEGSRHRILARNDGIGPVWSPDGSWIAFSTAAHSKPGVYVVGPDTGRLRRLPSTWSFSPVLSWRPCVRR